MALMTRRNPPSLTDMVEWLETMRPIRAALGDGFIPIEEYREDGHYVVRADLPGVDPEKDISVTVEEGCLCIHGERRHEEHAKRVELNAYEGIPLLPRRGPASARELELARAAVWRSAISRTHSLKIAIRPRTGP